MLNVFFRGMQGKKKKGLDDEEVKETIASLEQKEKWINNEL